MIAGAYGSRLYTSTNYGANWVEQQPDGNANKNWSSVACDSTGTHLYACSQDASVGKVWHYNGSSWSQIYPKGVGNAGMWRSIKCSSDGSRVVIVENNGRVWQSINYGSTWAELRPIDNNDYTWYDVEMDSDGSHILISRNTTLSVVYVSTDYGATWTTPSLVSGSWRSLAMNADGSRMVAAAYNGYVYVSSDSGATWARDTNLSSAAWFALDVNAAGDRMVVGYSSQGYVYTYAPVAAATSAQGTWSQNTHIHTETVHQHAGGTMTVSVPQHNHMWLTGHTTYNAAAAQIDIYAERSGNDATGIMVEVTKADSRNPTADLYTSNATGAGGTASGNTANNAASNTGSSSTVNTYRPLACLGIVAKLTTIPTA
jgi:photosystem II stability/assembly factor-like uncharacterized protein